MCILSGVNFDTVVAMVDWTLGDPAVLVSLPSSQPLRWDFIPTEDILWLINETQTEQEKNCFLKIAKNLLCSKKIWINQRNEPCNIQYCEFQIKFPNENIFRFPKYRRSPWTIHYNVCHISIRKRDDLLQSLLTKQVYIKKWRIENRKQISDVILWVPGALWN